MSKNTKFADRIPEAGTPKTDVPATETTVSTNPEILPTADGRVPCVGLPVQYFENHGPVPALLVMQNRVAKESGTWDLRAFPQGAVMPAPRIGKKFSATPKAGCWSYLPGWSFNG